MSKRNSKSTRRSTRQVYNVSENGTYNREHRLSRIGMKIRRGDTRHGGTSNVVLWDRASAPKAFVMSLAEARAFKAFLDRELSVLAR